MKMPPINLWSKPSQEMYEQYLQAKADRELTIAKSKLRAKQLQSFIALNERILKATEHRLKELNFIYYTRTGKFYDDNARR